jgi:hypothetical protein
MIVGDTINTCTYIYNSSGEIWLSDINTIKSSQFALNTEVHISKGIRQLQQHDMPPKPEVMPGAPETG